MTEHLDDLSPDPGRYATPEEFADRFGRLRPEHRLRIAATVVDQAQRSQDCFVADHAGELRTVREQRRQLQLAINEVLPAALFYNDPADIIRGLGRQRDSWRDIADHLAETARRLEGQLLVTRRALDAAHRAAGLEEQA